MRKNKKQRYSLKTAFTLQNRMMKRWWKEAPSHVIIDFFNIAWNALIPYLHIYLSALFFDELAGARRPDQIKLYVLLILLAAIVSGAVPAILGRIKLNTHFDSDHWYFRKILDLDFADADDPKCIEERHRIFQASTAGMGNNVFGQYKAMVSDILSILGGISLTVSLFIIKVPESGGWLVVLNNPLFVLLLIGIMLSIIYVVPVLQNKAGKIHASHAYDHMQANREFSYFYMLGYYQSHATDCRIFQHDKYIEGTSKN